jgi:hypothetical protein
MAVGGGGGYNQLANRLAKCDPRSYSSAELYGHNNQSLNVTSVPSSMRSDCR